MLNDNSVMSDECYEEEMCGLRAYITDAEKGSKGFP